jgi:hypothetical protein
VKRDDPQLWKIYEQLGRFRNALLLDEAKRQPAEPLKQFISLQGLEGHGG